MSCSLTALKWSCLHALVNDTMSASVELMRTSPFCHLWTTLGCVSVTRAMKTHLPGSLEEFTYVSIILSFVICSLIFYFSPSWRSISGDRQQYELSISWYGLIMFPQDSAVLSDITSNRFTSLEWNLQQWCCFWTYYILVCFLTLILTY